MTFPEAAAIADFLIICFFIRHWIMSKAKYFTFEQLASYN